MRAPFLMAFCCFAFFISSAQTNWINVDSLYQPLPKSVKVFYTNNGTDSLPFKAFYLVADLMDNELLFTTDTTYNRRLTPAEFYAKNSQPLVVVNGTFFSFETNRNLNVVVKNKKLVARNVHSIAGRGKDTLTYRHPFTGAIGITKKRKADVAWILTDSSTKKVYASQVAIPALKDSVGQPSLSYIIGNTTEVVAPSVSAPLFKRWKVETAIGGGPVLLQNGQLQISNNEELKFGGKAINDRHPRTAMGYTADNKLIILVVEGRNPGASGATLGQEAALLQELGCVEALNLDGGGSSCLLINGKETIQPSDKKQRAVPAVFIIQQKGK